MSTRPLMLAALLLLVPLTGCIGGEDDPVPPQEEPVDQLEDWDVYYVQSTDDLPLVRIGHHGSAVLHQRRLRIPSLHQPRLGLHRPHWSGRSSIVNGTNGVNGLDGMNGLNGTNGVNGLNGTNGVNGTDGFTALASTTPIPSNASTCVTSNGGFRSKSVSISTGMGCSMPPRCDKPPTSATASWRERHRWCSRGTCGERDGWSRWTHWRRLDPMGTWRRRSHSHGHDLP